MGSIRLGNLPRTREWRQVVGLLECGARVEQVAAAAIRASEKAFGRAFHDDGLVESVWLLFHLPLAARADGFVHAARGCGLHLPEDPLLMDLLGAFTDAVDASLAPGRRRTDLGEMAQMAAAEALADSLRDGARGLFDTGPEDLRRALGGLGTTRGLCHLGRRFFARLLYKTLDFFLSRAYPEQVGEGRRFATLAQVDEFCSALEVHCGEAAAVVEAFTGEWFSKYHWETRGNVTRDLVRAFAHGAARKLTDELKRGGRADG